MALTSLGLTETNYGLDTSRLLLLLRVHPEDPTQAALGCFGGWAIPHAEGFARLGQQLTDPSSCRETSPKNEKSFHELGQCCWGRSLQKGCWISASQGCEREMFWCRIPGWRRLWHLHGSGLWNPLEVPALSCAHSHALPWGELLREKSQPWASLETGAHWCCSSQQNQMHLGWNHQGLPSSCSRSWCSREELWGQGKSAQTEVIEGLVPEPPARFCPCHWSTGSCFLS